MSITILIVTDAPDTRQVLTAWLQGEGYQIINVSSAQETLLIAAQQQPHLILVDITVSAIDGLEIYHNLRANPKTSRIPILLIADEYPGEINHAGLSTATTDYLVKPVNLPDLSERVTHHLNLEDDQQTIKNHMLEALVNSALSMLPCEFAWLLGVEGRDNTLSSQALAIAQGDEAFDAFVRIMRKYSPGLAFSLDHLQHPVIEILLARRAVFGVPVGQFAQQSSTQGLHHALASLDLVEMTLVPLVVGSRATGLLILGTSGESHLNAPRERHIITSLSSQAAITLDYTRLAEHLAEQEEQMFVEQAFLNMVLDTMGDGLVVIDGEGQVAYVNNRLLRMTGYTRQEVFGLRIDRLFHPEDREQLMNGLLQKLGATMKFEQRLYTKTERVIPVLLSRSAFADIEPGMGHSAEQVLVLSDLTEQKRRQEALERQSQQLQALNQASQAITSTLSIHEVITQILNAAVDVVQSDGASILLRSADNPNELVFIAAVGPMSDTMYGLRVPFGEGIAGWVAREAKSQLVPDTSKDSRFYASIDDTTGLTTRSLIAVPLIQADDVIGVLEVVNKREGTFDQLEVELLESMAGTAAVALENARLFDQTRRRLVELGTLLDASAAVSSTLDFGSVLELIARRLADTLHVARCLVTSWDRASNTLRSLAEVVNASWGPDVGPISRLAPLPLRRAALVSGLPVLAHVSDPHCEPADRSELQSFGQQAMLGVPLWLGKHVVGLVALYSSLIGHQFTDEDAVQVEHATQQWQRELGEAAGTRWHEEGALTELCNQLLAMPGVTWVAVEAWEPEHNQTRRLRESGFTFWTEQLGFRQQLDDFPTMRRVLSTANPKVVGLVDLEADPNELNLMRRMGGQVCLLVPLIIRGESQGLVKLISPDPGRVFDTEEISLAQGIANVVGNAMENAQLYQGLERRARALEAAYAELQEEGRLKDELLQNLSHEIQTPLLHILGYAELMHDGSFGPLNDEQREHLDFIIERAHRLSGLAKDIVSVHELKTEQMVDMRPTDLEGIIRQTIRIWAPHATKRAINMDARIPPHLPLVMAESKRLAEALDQLIDNAVKFSPQGGRIEIGADDADGMVKVYVRDDGPGIPKEAHERIFQRFYQVDGSASRQFGGTGLGLAIAYEIITQHGGKIWVESEPGQGSTFVFTLPKITTVIATDGGSSSPPLSPDA